jgi:predicted dehydrogenase
MAAAKVKGPVRVAIIGVGGITGAHAQGFIKHPDKLRVVAMADVVRENMEKRADQIGGERPAMFADWKAMLADMGDKVDAVDIALPHHLHAAAILDACAAGKHVLCEKPMCTSLKDADRIAAAVKKSGVTYMSAHNQLFMPAVREAKRMIDEGQIGKVLWLRSQDCFMAGGEGGVKNWNWRAKLATQGGGELIDTGYHPSYRLLHLAGSPVAKVQGTMGRYLQKIEGEDTASVQVRFENGAIGEILTSWAFGNPHGTHQIHVIGTKGQIFGSENTLYYLPKGYSEPAKMQFPETQTFEAELVHFAECLTEGKRPIHSVEEGRAVLELILAASKSADGWQGRVNGKA